MANTTSGTTTFEKTFYIDKIIEENKTTNSKIAVDTVTRNIKWKPIKFEFDNMFAYGENNVINFENMRGIYGIFGPNRCGKSSIIDALSFCLFDKGSRFNKAVHVKNTEKMRFGCKLEFDIDGTRYFIQRLGETTRTGNVKVNVRFWKLVDGVEVELHGTERRSTNDIIKEYVGTYEDFILTTASIQSAKNNISFIDMGNSERKDLLVQFMGLDIYDKLYEVANEKYKEVNSTLKVHRNENYAVSQQEAIAKLVIHEGEFKKLESELEALTSQITATNELILQESGKISKLNLDIFFVFYSFPYNILVNLFYDFPFRHIIVI